MWRSILHALQTVLVMLSIGQIAQGVNPAQWMIVEELRRTDSTKTWVSPTAIDLGKMAWQYDYEITKLTATVNVPLIGDVTDDITDLIPADQRIASGETRNLPAVLLDDMIVESTSGSSADVRVEVDELGFGRAVFSNIVLGSINVPLFGQAPIQRVNLEASVAVVGYDFGDYNRDGSVDAADYVLWRQTQGQMAEGLAADGNGDNEVDVEDYAVWRANFGTGAGPALGSVAVPEPATWIFVLAGLVATLGLRARFLRAPVRVEAKLYRGV